MANKKINYETEEIGCPICGPNAKKTKMYSAPDRINNLPGLFTVYRCEVCDTAFQNPRPKEKCISMFYIDDLAYFQPPTVGQSKIKQFLERNVLANYYNYPIGIKNILLKIILYPLYFSVYRSTTFPKYLKNGNLLEIGCSHGYKLKKLQEYGWNKIEGVEPYKKAAEYARKRGLTVRTGSIEDSEYKKESFDVIILDMVVEHLYNPKVDLKKVESWLKRGGQLIFSIPFIQGIEFEIHKEYARSLHLPNHINFLSKKGIYKILSPSFKDITLRFQHFDTDMFKPFIYRYNDNKNIFYKILGTSGIIRYLIFKPFIFIFSVFGQTGRVTIFATKK